MRVRSSARLENLHELPIVYSQFRRTKSRKGCFFGYDVSVDRFLAEEMRGDKVCFSPSRINRKEGGKGFDI